MSRKLPETSHAANKSATHEMREQHYQKIIAALNVLVSANYEKIAEQAGMERHQVGRRLSEMERVQIVYKSGLQSDTSSGRKAFNYSLTGQPKTDTQAREITYKPGVKNASDFANDLIATATKPLYIPGKLF